VWGQGRTGFQQKPYTDIPTKTRYEISNKQHIWIYQQEQKPDLRFLTNNIYGYTNKNKNQIWDFQQKPYTDIPTKTIYQTVKWSFDSLKIPANLLRAFHVPISLVASLISFPHFRSWTIFVGSLTSAHNKTQKVKWRLKKVKSGARGGWSLWKEEKK
jgi:hypothetical protein